ncbi:hypothetical protein [Frankia nepalensis]|uniref:DUF8083 domain-containing protein n=1 Tax=Frankia nepalensis TaxID=1836974 RepID=A0A937RCG3_9ACTN|nr:hypothetical protein [Frankia nepalensis]MBL7627712.1 hypothetical protein [Frankia nepalensis]
MPVVSPAAYLRVYEPLAAFSPAERLRWQRFAATAPPSRRAGTRRERMVALVAAVRPTLDVAGESAFVQVVDGLMFVCPWSTQLRVWQAALEFRGGMPERIAEVFLPRRIVDPAETELDRWRARRPELKVHIQSSTWSVPSQWFLLFDPSERLLVTGDAAERSMIYRTEIGLARRRIAEATEALAAMRTVMPDSSASEGVTDLSRWLDSFHPRSRIELDYDGLVDLLDDDVLRRDNSVEDLAEAVRALRQGRTDRATEAYERVLVRWRPLQARESAS